MATPVNSPVPTLVLPDNLTNGIYFVYKWTKIAKYIQQRQLAPFITGPTDQSFTPIPPLLQEECPICCVEFKTPINRTKCCLQPICTGCLLQLKPQLNRYQSTSSNNHHQSSNNSTESPPLLSTSPTKCPFCANDKHFSILYFEQPQEARQVVKQYKQKRKSSLWRRLTTPNIYAGIELDSLRKLTY